MIELKDALLEPLWVNHKIGDTYDMINVNKSIERGWSIAYYPLFGTYKNGLWVEFSEPRALIEKGNDFRELPIRYLNKSN